MNNECDWARDLDGSSHLITAGSFEAHIDPGEGGETVGIRIEFEWDAHDSKAIVESVLALLDRRGVRS